MYFQKLILTLQHYWNERGCLLAQPYDIEKGAGTFNPNTFLRSLGPEPFRVAYAEPCRRPCDGRYGDNPIRMQHYYQFQVILKPSPHDILDLYLGSLEAIGIKADEHDIRFVHDDWESPTLGAWGLGWEVWADGMEVTQFTYFQQVGGIELAPVCGEITYGLERLCMFLQGVDNVYDLQYNEDFTYGDIFHENEVQGSVHNFELADVGLHFDLFDRYERECLRLAAAANPVTATDYCLKASHSFNLLDARGAISVNERQNYILRVRTLSRQIAESWLSRRAELGFPLREKASTVIRELPSTGPAEVPPLPERAPLLVELGIEEMPAQVFEALHRQLPELFGKFFSDLGLDPQGVSFFSTPRRLALCVDSIKTRQDDQALECKGPPLRIARDGDGEWTSAAQGFARKNGIELAAAEVRSIGKEDYLFARIERPGRAALEVLGETIPAFLAAIHWYKTMRWGTGKTAFVRPVHWLCAKLGEAVIPCEFAGIQSSDKTRGHRFLSSHPFAIGSDREGYLNTLREHHVLADPDERRETIRHLICAAAEACGLTWLEDEALLDEVNNLVEFPVPVLHEFNAKYLKIPETVLVSEMKGHQKYFACRQADGQLSNHFIAVSNMPCKNMKLVADGYEKVLRSRFDDAAFFLHDDVKIRLMDRVPLLQGITFQAKLGSIGDKVARIRKLSETICEQINMDDGFLAHADQIALLCKADLTTKMVGEFPELQGEIGTYYAREEGLDPLVAQGLEQHYLPKNLRDTFPESGPAAIVGLADRIDSLVGIAAVVKLPTGSADPFALRRACLTGAAIIIQQRLHLDLKQLLSDSFDCFGDVLQGHDKQALIEDLLGFVLDRVKGMLRDAACPAIAGNFAYDSLDAVARSSAGWLDLTDYVDRVNALETFRQREDFADVVTTFKRTNNILAEPVPGAMEPDCLQEPAEQGLIQAMNDLEGRLNECMAQGDYVAAMSEIGSLRPIVSAFFDAVMVNAPEERLRLNRQRLVQRVVTQVLRLADFAAIQESN